MLAILLQTITRQRLAQWFPTGVPFTILRAPTWVWAGGELPRGGTFRGGGRHFWRKEGIANGLSRMKLKLDLGLGFRFWLRLDLPHVPVCPGLSRFKRLSRYPVPVRKMSQNFTSVKFSKLSPA